VTEPSHAVFLSYASQDAQAAQKIAEALRAAGIEVWFDQSELRGGDVWDQMIRKQIKACALFIPVISRHTHERREGYFRLEWKLAVDRSNLISATQAFLLPVVIDGTREDDEEIPEKIRDIHWTRLPEGTTHAAFVDRVKRLLSGGASTSIRQPASSQSGLAGGLATPPPAWTKRGLLVALAVLLLAAVAYLAIGKLWISKPAVVSPPAMAASAAPAAFNPPPHSIAVLPFVNMSADKEQEYFSDGLTEEILNSLARINKLQVTARTSSFSFKGKDTDLSTVAHKLNVASILEGSVRRAGHTVRVTAQLNNAITGFHLWSQTYDGDLRDVLKLQTDIATAVARSLKVALLGDIGPRIDQGGTSNPAAFDAYLRGSRAHDTAIDADGFRSAIAEYTNAIRLDPSFALAFADRSSAHLTLAWFFPLTRSREIRTKALTDAQRAIALAPDLAKGHRALAGYFEDTLDFARASAEYERAASLAPGDAATLRSYGWFSVRMGHTDAGITQIRQSIALDPLNPAGHTLLSFALYFSHRYEESIAAVERLISLEPSPTAYVLQGSLYVGLGNFESARASCEKYPDDPLSQICLAVVYEKLGRHKDAEAQLSKVQASRGDAAAVEYAEVYAQRGDIPKALEWLEAAMRLHDPGLAFLKVDPDLDPIRNEPRFQAVVRELKFPD
jgi:TolB-like protein/Tfp pilus assembly protein PilF